MKTVLKFWSLLPLVLAFTFFTSTSMAQNGSPKQNKVQNQYKKQYKTQNKSVQDTPNQKRYQKTYQDARLT